jgi:hypothetical protein
MSRRSAPTHHTPPKDDEIGRYTAMQSEKNLSRKLVQITICGAYAPISSRTILNHIKAERISFSRLAIGTCSGSNFPGARPLAEAVGQKINRKYFLQE